MIKIFAICPVCEEPLAVGKVDEKVVGACGNKKCLSVLVYGEPIQKVFKNKRTRKDVKGGENEKN